MLSVARENSSVPFFFTVGAPALWSQMCFFYFFVVFLKRCHPALKPVCQSAECQMLFYS